MKKFLANYKGSYASYCTAVFFFFFSMSIFSSILGVYLTGIGKTPKEMSFIISASGMFSIVFTPFIGYLNDRVKKPKRLVFFVLISVGVLGLAFSFIRETVILFLLNGLIMTGISSMSPVVDKTVGFCKYRYGSVRVWGTLGFAGASQFAGIILQYLPSVYLFVLMFITICLSIVGFTSTDNIKFEKSEEESDEKAKAFDLFKNKHYILHIIIALLFIGSNGVHMTYLPILIGEMGVSLTVVGTILFIGTVTEIPMIFFSNKFMDKYSCTSLIIIAHATLFFSFIIFAFVNNLFIVVAVTLVFKAMPSMLFSMLNLRIIANLVNAKIVSTALALSSSLMSFGSVIIQNVSGNIASQFSTQAVYVFLCGVLLISFIPTLFIRVPNKIKMFNK